MIYICSSNESEYEENKKKYGSKKVTDLYKFKENNIGRFKVITKQAIRITKEYETCRKCRTKLTNKASRIWGICPSCDNE